MTVRSARGVDDDRWERDQISSLAIEISDWQTVAGRRPLLAWQLLIGRCDPATPGKHPASGMDGVDLHV
jgi:hypothetical protein